jgi:hypothetical protein
LIEKICRGELDDAEFLTCPPQHKVVAAYDGSKMAAEAL